MISHEAVILGSNNPSEMMSCDHTSEKIQSVFKNWYVEFVRAVVCLFLG